jgi:hypothetical protein
MKNKPVAASISPVRFDWENLHVISWEKSRDVYQVETPHEHLKRSWQIFSGANTDAADWIVVGYANSQNNAKQQIEVLKQKRSRFVSVPGGEADNGWIQKHILKHGSATFDRADVKIIFGKSETDGIRNLKLFADQLGYRLYFPPNTHLFILESRKV